ncbi:quinone oxidoreductase family protein [Aquisediminimonas sediminicola]|uniref:quinone oxidoreductase family protein n=1 Tax=Alteraquisediminimonas sediminicola TaxID=2676787 RepID=UPI0031B850C3
MTFGTAYDALFTYGDLKAGETVLVQGAAGGVGLAAVQLAAQAGARVIGTAAGSERLNRLRELGMHHGIDYKSQSISEVCRTIAGEAGIDMVVDMAGGTGVGALIESLRRHGRYLAVGASTGSVPSFGFFDVINKALTVKGITFGLEMHTARAHALIECLFVRVGKGELVMPIDREFALADAVESHHHVAGGHPFGRVLLHP